MKAFIRWSKGVGVKNIGEMSQTKKPKRSKSNQKEDICLNCKEKICRGTCKNFKR
jgi:hypothetical protein